jgi:hypothetical protein
MLVQPWHFQISRPGQTYRGVLGKLPGDELHPSARNTPKAHASSRITLLQIIQEKETLISYKNFTTPYKPTITQISATLPLPATPINFMVRQNPAATTTTHFVHILQNASKSRQRKFEATTRHKTPPACRCCEQPPARRQRPLPR